LFVAELVRNRRLTAVTQERLRAIVQTSPAAIITVDDCGFVDLANRAADELMIPQQGHLSGQPIDSFVPELQHALRQEATQFRTSMQCRARRGDGESFVADVWFSTYYERATRKLAAIIADVSEEHSSAIRSSAEPPDLDRPALNSREVAILRLVFEGLTNREVASKLEMTGSAVKNALERLFRKTGVNSRSQLVRVALERYRDVL
jgi:PAS domain S-box-containing protein